MKYVIATTDGLTAVCLRACDRPAGSTDHATDRQHSLLQTGSTTQTRPPAGSGKAHLVAKEGDIFFARDGKSFAENLLARETDTPHARDENRFPKVAAESKSQKYSDTFHARDEKSQRRIMRSHPHYQI
jgi:hypothetical protein